MLTRWRGGPATAIVIFLVVCLLVTSIPAAADTDLAAGHCDAGLSHAPYTGAGPSTYAAPKGCDSDTSTAFIADGSGAGGGADCLGVDLGSATTIGSFSIIVDDRSKSGHHINIYATNSLGSGGSCGVGSLTNALGGSTSIVIDTGGTSGTGACAGWGSSCWASGTVSFPAGLIARYWFADEQTGGTCGTCIVSFELYAGSSIGDPLDYIYNLRAAHPSFARQYRWNWAQTFSGTYTFTDSSARVIATRTDTFVAGSEEPLPPQPPVTILCLPICGHDTYTITITDGSVTATYDIDSDADGQLIDDVVPPVLTGATFCYIKTTGQCSDLPGYISGAAAVGQIWTYYNFTGAAGLYYVELCERAQELAPPACWPYTAPTGGVNDTLTPGAYTSVFVHDTSHFESDQSLVHVWDRFGHNSYLISPLLDLGSGGKVTITQQQPITPESTIVCGQLDVLCGIRALFSLGPGAIEAGFGTLMTPLRAKQPFATIIGSAPTILAQLQRASDAVTSTDNCTGVDIQVPLGITGLMTAPPVNGRTMPTPPVAPSSIPGAAGRTAGPFTARVLDCATFESIVGGWSWFPTFRAFQDVALYAVYGYSQLRRWQPKPQMTA